MIIRIKPSCHFASGCIVAVSSYCKIRIEFIAYPINLSGIMPNIVDKSKMKSYKEKSFDDMKPMLNFFCLFNLANFISSVSLKKSFLPVFPDQKLSKTFFNSRFPHILEYPNASVLTICAPSAARFSILPPSCKY